MNRRRFLTLALVSTAAVIAGRQFVLASPPSIRVIRDPNCGCCLAWADHLRESGFAVSVVDDPAINRVKARLGVPRDLTSCHTAEVDGYAIEGHVPAGAIKKLLSERPAIKGLSVPGMPVGSPGMEVEGREPDTYDVIAFGASGNIIFARYQGATELAL
jgi:hypothetical protein